jgi:hypothetical protein
MAVMTHTVDVLWPHHGPAKKAWSGPIGQVAAHEQVVAVAVGGDPRPPIGSISLDPAPHEASFYAFGGTSYTRPPAGRCHSSGLRTRSRWSRCWIRFPRCARAAAGGNDPASCMPTSPMTSAPCVPRCAGAASPYASPARASSPPSAWAGTGWIAESCLSWLLNNRFWASPERLDRLRRAKEYRTQDQVVLHVGTRALVERHGSRIER